MPRAKSHTCPLCGADLDPVQRCRPSCPRRDRCAVICCPRCAYTFPSEEVGLAGILRRLFERGRGR